MPNYDSNRLKLLWFDVTVADKSSHREQRRMISVVNFFVVAICDLVHHVETVFHLSYVLYITASGKSFLKYE